MKSYLTRIVHDYNSLVRSIRNKIIDLIFPRKTLLHEVSSIYLLKNQPHGVLRIAPGVIVRPKYGNCFKRPVLIKSGVTPLLEQFRLETIKDGHFIIYELPKYGKALEEFVEHGTFTIDDIDYVSTYNSGVISIFDTVPYNALLFLIFDFSIFESTHGNKKFRAQKINGVSNAPIVPEIIKAYRQLTLYGYKVEIPFSEEDISIYTRRYVFSDADTHLHVSVCLDKLKEDENGRLLIEKTKYYIEKICSAADNYLEQYTTKGIVCNNINDANGSYIKVGYDSIINLQFNHSNGSTSDTDRKSRFSQRRLFGIPYDSAVFHSADSFDVLRDISSSDVAKLTFVPKDSRGPRTICMEPSYLGFIQQLYMTVFYAVMPQVTNFAIDLENQDNNRYMALVGSDGGKYATIDLSNASDSVMILHIRNLFPSRWIDILDKCRSILVHLPDGTTLRPNKYAPMGSALCFPIECIIFYAITKAIVGDSHLSVYGDDIIVERHYAEAVMSALEAFGFTVNRKKSFYKSDFRESCGIFAYKGKDVSCIYRRDLTAQPEHYNEIIQSYGCDIAPQSFVRLPNVEGCINRIPTSGELKKYISSGIFAWDTYLHRVCVRVRVHRSRHTGDVLPDNFAYSEWLRLYSGKDTTFLIKPRIISRRQESDIMVEKYIPTTLPYSELGYIHQVTRIFEYFGYKVSPSNIDATDSQELRNNIRGVRYVRFKTPKKTKQPVHSQSDQSKIGKGKAKEKAIKNQKSQKVKQPIKRRVAKGNDGRKIGPSVTKSRPTGSKTPLVKKENQGVQGKRGK